MGVVELKHCNRCQSDKPESEWYASTWHKSGQWCRECYRQWHRDRYATSVDDNPRDCAWCGLSYQPKQRRVSEFCSRLCKDRARKALEARVRVESKPLDRECLHCGAILPQVMRADAIFCSQRCNEAAHALQRKLRMRTGQDNKPGYLRAAICKRDKWTCGICHERVNPALEHPHPRCASMDHILPVCRGGLSDPANLRLVHLVCNLRRRHLGEVEQLAMFG